MPAAVRFFSKSVKRPEVAGIALFVQLLGGGKVVAIRRLARDLVDALVLPPHL